MAALDEADNGIEENRHPEEAAPGPRSARPEDRLRGCLEEPALAKAGDARC
jgi:hypothetical protein